MPILNTDYKKWVKSLDPLIKEVKDDYNEMINEILFTLFEGKLQQQFNFQQHVVVMDYAVYEKIYDLFPAFVKLKVTILSGKHKHSIFVLDKDDSYLDKI